MARPATNEFYSLEREKLLKNEKIMKKIILGGVTMIAIIMITVITVISLKAEQFCTQGSLGICIPTISPAAFSCGWTNEEAKDCGGTYTKEINVSSFNPFI
jgi:hypothetical protein